MYKQKNRGKTTVKTGGFLQMENEGVNFFKGLAWGTAISIPLWISIIGWAQLFLKFL